MQPDHGVRRNQWRLLDVSSMLIEGDVGLPFAVEEEECERVGAGADSLLHLWRHRHALVLGLRDRKLPHAKNAMESFRREGRSVIVRNSGGTAVPLDDGVVNVSLVMKNRPGAVNIHDDFAVMAKLIADTVRSLSGAADVRAGEIEGAYCPGEYDLSIGGVKFCGIAQRRKLGAYVIQAFVVVEGEGAARAEAAARFYREAAGAAPSPNALLVTNQSTRSLQELLGTHVTADDFATALKQTLLGEEDQVSETHTSYHHYDQAKLQSIVQSMKQRYDTD